jgi:hypothetical protein
VSSRLSVVVALLLVSCGCEYSRPGQRPDAGESFDGSGPRDIPACLLNGSLIGKPVDELNACDPGYCAITGDPAVDATYFYCPSGCGAGACPAPFRVWTKDGIITKTDSRD